MLCNHFLPIALVVSWLMLAKRKRESFVCFEAWYRSWQPRFAKKKFLFPFLLFLLFINVIYSVIDVYVNIHTL